MSSANHFSREPLRIEVLLTTASPDSPELIPPTPGALREALELSGEILRQLELSEIPLSNLALKTARLARLLNDSRWEQIMAYEVGGYPTVEGFIPPVAWTLIELANRVLPSGPSEPPEQPATAFTETIGQLEESLETTRLRLQAASDPSVSISSANPTQIVLPPSGNKHERLGLQTSASRLAGQLSSRRMLVYEYALRAHYRLKFSGVASDLFSRTRERVDRDIGFLVPHAVQKLSAIYDNLASENPEDWSNAAHGCRRLLQALADELFAPQEDRKIVRVDNKEGSIKLGTENYINRLICYVEDRSDSGRFREIVGSQLSYLGNRLDAIFQAAQKGSHAIVAREEADRCVIYTYLVVGDILTLSRKPAPHNSGPELKM